jgi:hypothetical protein
MDEETANALMGFAGLLLAAVVIVGHSLNLFGVDAAIPLLGLAVASLAFGVVPFEKLP